jgi:hypothetical protein
MNNPLAAGLLRRIDPCRSAPGVVRLGGTLPRHARFLDEDDQRWVA